jgi:ABC-type multidrug transport system permease subunit
MTSFLLASIAGTQIILADIKSFGLGVSFSDRVSATLHDIIGLGPSLSIMIGAAFLVAFIVAALCYRFLGGKRTYWYLAAGFTSIPATLLLIKTLMGGTLFAAARGGLGMLLIAICGLAGGWVFARLTEKRGL